MGVTLESGLQPCPPYREDFLFGFSRVLDIVAEHSSEFIKRMDRPSITEMSVRVLPCGTTTLTNSRQILTFTKSVEPDNFYAIQRQQLIIEWLQELERFKEEKGANTDSIIPRLTYPVPRFAAMYSGHLHEEIEKYNVPIFYAKAGEKTIYNCQGQAVEIDFAEVKSNGECTFERQAEMKQLKLQGNSQQYFTASGTEMIQDFIQALSTNDELGGCCKLSQIRVKKEIN